MRTLPSGFGSLSNIVELHLDENHIMELPEDIGSLSLLENIDLGKGGFITTVFMDEFLSVSCA